MPGRCAGRRPQQLSTTFFFLPLRFAIVLVTVTVAVVIFDRRGGERPQPADLEEAARFSQAAVSYLAVRLLPPRAAGASIDLPHGAVLPHAAGEPCGAARGRGDCWLRDDGVADAQSWCY